MVWSLCLLKVLLLVITFLPPSTESKRRDPTCPLKKPFKTLTYNAFLSDSSWLSKNLPIDENREERRDALIDYLKTTDACVVCLQETYLGPDIQAITEALSDTFPYAQSQLHSFNGALPPQTTGVREPVCEIALAVGLIGCALAECFDTTTLNEFVQCSRVACEDEVLAILRSARGSKCIICLLNRFGGNFDVCAESNSSDTYWDINPMGLLLLSKKPMSNRQIVPHYQGVTQRLTRGYIQATIDDKIKFACSHQTPTDLVSFELLVLCEPVILHIKDKLIALLEKSFALLDMIIANVDRQNDFEIDDLIRRLKNEKALVLMGAINVGGPGKGVQPLHEERFERLNDVFNTCPVKQCTVCAANPYNGFDDTTLDVNTDHIFSTYPLKVTNTKVVLTVDDASVQVEGSPYPLSHRYGVEATIACSRSRTTKHRRSSKRGHRRYRRYA